MSLTEENSKGFPNFEGDSDDNDQENGEKTPLVTPGSRDRPTFDLGVGFDFDLDFDVWMRKYVRWTDERPLLSRCVVSATTAFVGVLLARATTTGSHHKLSARSQKRQQRPLGEDIDILEAISFAVHGGLVAGPLSYYINEFLKRQRRKPKNSTMSSSTYDLLIDQVVMAPPKLYLTFLTVDVTKTLLKRALPEASRKSVALLASALSDSLRFWPLSIYVLLKLLKKRRHYEAAINLCSIAFSMHLAKKRNAGN